MQRTCRIRCSDYEPISLAWPQSTWAIPASGGDCAKLLTTMRGIDVWIDPKGYQSAVAEREHAFEAELSREQSAPL